MKKNAFTLIELLIVISIIAVILGLVSANLMGARSRARDAKAKAEMKELKNALRLYYNDYQSYPADDDPFLACGEGGVEACPNAVGCAEFAAWSVGGVCDDATSTTYMKRLPRAANGTDYSFTYNIAGGDDFCLATPLENAADTEIAISQTRCASACGANCNSGTLYCMCAD